MNRRSCWIPALLWIGMVAAWAQPQISVPFSNPTSGRHPLVRVTLLNGGAEIKGYDGKDVQVNTAADQRRSSRRKEDPASQGMYRIDFGSGFSVQEENNIVNIHGSGGGTPRLVIQMPASADLEVKCTNCSELKISSLSGDIDVNTTNAGIRLEDVTGAVLAHSLNHGIVASFDRLPTKPLSFSSMNGSIDLTFPTDLKANLKVKTTNGKINTEFDLRLAGGTLMHPTRGLAGTINGGGSELNVNSFNGSIYLRRKK